MSFEQSFADFADFCEIMDTGCQALFDEVNDGNPSPALQYSFYKEAQAYFGDEPVDDPLVQVLLVVHIQNRIIEAEKSLILNIKAVLN